MRSRGWGGGCGRHEPDLGARRHGRGWSRTHIDTMMVGQVRVTPTLGALYISKFYKFETICNLKAYIWGSLGGAAVWCLPLAQGAILETRDRIPRRAPGAWSLLLPLPMSLPLSLSLSL